MSERGYRWEPEDYARHSSAQAQWALELLGKLDLRAAEAVLDIGSGDGKVTAALAAQVPRGRVLQGTSRALKHGGRERPWDAWLAGFPCPWSFYGPEEYRGWLEQSGLEARRVELIPKEMRQQGPEGLAGWARTTWLPYTQAVPAERREELVSRVVERYLSGHPPDADGTVRVQMVRLEVEAGLEAETA